MLRSCFPAPEFMNFNLFGKTILVVNKKFGRFFLAIHSASEVLKSIVEVSRSRSHFL